jgi:3D (Asp-Asp-Asp) domain-containing protein/peptidoglycan hydrolase CwlO-like protein
VDEGSRRSWIRFAATGAIALTALLSATAARADDPATLRSEAERLRAENDSIAARSQSALLDLYSLERRLARAEARVADLRSREAALERERAAAQHRLQIARADVAEAERRLGLRLSDLYVQGEVDPIAVLLAAESLDDALSAVDGLTRMADQDGSILRQLRDARRELRDSLRAFGERQAALDRVLGQAEAEQASLAAARAERAAYVAGLASRQALNAAQIDRLSDQAERASESTPVEPAPAPQQPAPQPTPGPHNPGGSPMTVDVVAYCGGVGTASGLPLGWGTVAVDTRIFPFGTKMYIPGYGDGVAADRGSAIVGKIIDIWFPTCAQARAWGRKTLTITVYW